jgi:O-antigen/teichoic acid export membrane protein
VSASLSHRPEFVRAARSALTLGASLLAGIACSLAVRVVLPRVLGPVAFGEYRLVETVAELVLVILTLGLDTALRRDVARDPASAHARLASVLALRTVGGVALIVVIVGGFSASGASLPRVSLLALLAVGQLLLSLNNTHAAVAHGVGDVRWSAVASVVARAVWAGVSLALLAVTASPVPVALTLVVVEGIRFVALQRRASILFGTSTARPDLRAAVMAAAASLPLFVNFLAHNFYGRLGTWWLGMHAASAEVGWYSAAANIASAALVGMPLVTWVLLPATSREGVDHSTTTDGLIAGALRIALLVATPAALLLAALAPTLVVALFGPQFAPAATTLALLAPTVAMAYGSTVCAVSLIQRGADRTVAVVSVAGLGLSLLLNAVLVHPGAPGEAASRAALAALLTEVAVTATLARLAWRRAWTIPIARATLGIAAAGTLAAVVARLLAAHGAVSLAAAASAYLLTLILTGTIGMPDVRFAQQTLSRGRSRAALAS